MSDVEDEVLEALYRLIAEEWQRLTALRTSVREAQTALRSLIAQALALGAAGRDIARRSHVPETNVRRWAGQADTVSADRGAA